MPPAKTRTDQLRRRLLDVAVEVLAEDGVAGVTTRRIAARAGTSAPAIYELFGDKAGLVRALFFEGFRRLTDHLDGLPPAEGTPDDVRAALRAFRAFARSQPRLFEVMYTRPFESFAPGPEERALGARARAVFVDRAAGAVAGGSLEGDPTDIAHAVLGLAIGLATQETAGWLGSTAPSRDRRWDDAVDALVRGYAAVPAS